MSEIVVKGNGDITLKLKWDDDPSSAGQAVGVLKVGGKIFRQKGEKGSQEETISTTTSSFDLVPEQGTLNENGFKKNANKRC